MFYLASPYSHEKKEMQDIRFAEACRAAADLIKRGFSVYSPIVHSYPITVVCPDLGGTWEHWERIDREFISKCDCLLVLEIPGYQESNGVFGEIGIATELGIPIGRMIPSGVGFVLDLPDEFQMQCEIKNERLVENG